MKPDCRHSAAAFTLIELVIVMTILLVIAGMAIPTLRTFGEGRRVSEAATQLVMPGCEVRPARTGR